MSIKNVIINYNKAYFQKVYHTKAYKDKIYGQLRDNRIYDKILNEELEEEECDSEKVFKFLKLLKRPLNSVNTTNIQLVIEEE